DDAFLVRRLHDVTQRAVVFRAHRLVRVWTTAFALLLFFVAREIRRDLFPRAAKVRSLQHILRAVKISVRLVLAPYNRRVPVETIFDVARVFAEVLNRRGHDVGARLRVDVEHLNRSLVTSAEHELRIVRIKRDEGALATG